MATRDCFNAGLIFRARRFTSPKTESSAWREPSRAYAQSEVGLLQIGGGAGLDHSLGDLEEGKLVYAAEIFKIPKPTSSLISSVAFASSF